MNVMWTALIALALCCIAPDTRAEGTIDPAVWGPYAQMAGKQATFRDDSGRTIHEEYRWIEPGRVLQHVQTRADGGKVVYQATISATGVPGQLDAIYETDWLKGPRVILLRGPSVALWADAILFQPAKQVALNPDGTWTERTVKLNPNLEVVQVKSVQPRSDVAALPPATASEQPAALATAATPAGAPTAASAPAVAASLPAPAVVAAPVSVPAATPIRITFGGMEEWIGKPLIGVQAGEIIELQRRSESELAVQFYSYTGTPISRYVFHADVDSGELVITEAPFTDAKQKWAQWQGQSLLLGSSTGRLLGGLNRYHTLTARRAGILVSWTYHRSNAIGMTTDEGDKTEEVFVPVTEALVAASATAQEEKQHMAALSAERRRQDQEDSARMAQAFIGGFVQGMGEAQQSYQQQDQKQAEFLRDTQSQVRAVEAYRRSQLQRAQAEQSAKSSTVAAPASVTAAPAATPGNSIATATSAKATATVPPKTSAAAAPKADAASSTSAQQDTRARQQAALAEAERKQQEDWQAYLQSEKAGIRLAAATCPGGQGRYYIGGKRPTQKSCVNVHYEARCPGTPSGQGARGTLANFVGGANCMGDTAALGGMLSCPAEQVRVDVLEVTGCT
ncbi:hypothetical protein ARC20_12450 [Stenotrophomonas panacihumi]|uniref:Uncharacterized protein n=2 Tax=Stenotrophomonas panacihumi TaxID=676599 RepID=A0A0R0A7D9_9GAMM|nr:hypothetical protein ARC20_12450 [Stenotrophomonas panacihumi]PTN55088.1 hypothetical protein C9J98_07780 [Stenotrophomonas panacihumi]